MRVIKDLKTLPDHIVAMIMLIPESEFHEAVTVSRAAKEIYINRYVSYWEKLGFGGLCGRSVYDIATLEHKYGWGARND
jgi:hypothetical protein